MFFIYIGGYIAKPKKTGSRRGDSSFLRIVVGRKEETPP